MKQTIKKHWEKLALGLSLLILIAYFVVGVAMAKPDRLVPDTESNTRKLNELLETRPIELPEKTDTVARIKTAFSPAIAATPGDANVYTRVPPVEVKPVVKASATGTARLDTKKLPVFKNPVLAAPVVEPGVIKLAWTDSPENKNLDAKDIAYLVYRKGPGDAGFVKITPEPISAQSFSDTKVEPQAEYQYIVGAIVTNEEVRSKLSPAPPGGELKSDPQSATGATTLALELKGVAEIPPEPDQPPVPTAQLMVKRFTDGAWKSKLYLVRKGDKIGTGDLATGFTVEELTRVTIQKTEEYTVPKFDDKGVKVGEEKKTRTREVATWEMKYKDETGKTQKLHPATGSPAKPAELAPKGGAESLPK